MKQLPFDLIRKAPKVDLHCHLDGSLSFDCLKKIMEQANVSVSDGQIKEQMRAPASCTSLEDYLKPFAYILNWLQTTDALQAAAYDVVKQAAEENVIYLEVRFAPLLHRRQGLSTSQVVKAVLDGLELAEREFGVYTGLILCMMRGAEFCENEETLATAIALFPNGVVGVDLAGSEAKYPPEQYGPLFQRAVAARIPITIHGGENGPAENVQTSIAMGATRIGHGLAIKGKTELEKLCKQKSVMLELCPVSNLQTRAAAGLESYPFEDFLRDGVAISINTDNRTVSNTTLTKQYVLLSQRFAITLDHMEHLAMNAIEHSFYQGDKRKLCEEIDRGYALIRCTQGE